MRVVMLSTDQKILEEGSAVRARMIEYANDFEQLCILLIVKKEFLISNLEFRINDKLTIYRISIWRALICPKLSFGQVDVVTAQDPFEIGFIGWRMARKLGAKLQLQIHTDFLSPYFTKYSLLNSIRVVIAKFLLPRANNIRVVSNRIKESLSTLGLNVPVTVQSIAVDTDYYKNASVTVSIKDKFPQFKKLILMASRLTKEKNIKLAINALSEILKTDQRWGLVICGDGPELKSLELLASNLKLQNNVIFLGWTDKATLASYYKTADLFLNTSLYEGYGMTLVEAKAGGISVFSTDVGVAREIGANIVAWDARAIAREIQKNYAEKF